MKKSTVILVEIFLPFILFFLLIKGLFKKKEEIKIIKPLQIPSEFSICPYCNCSVTLGIARCPYCGSLIVSPSSARHYSRWWKNLALLSNHEHIKLPMLESQSLLGQISSDSSIFGTCRLFLPFFLFSPSCNYNRSKRI